MDKEKIVETISDVGGSTTSALVGAGIGAAIAGPVGIAGGAIAGTAIEKVFQRIGEEIKNRVLSKSENEKIETVYECAKQKISFNLSNGKPLRNDDFYEQQVDDRSSSEEILEGTLFAAQREHEEKKLPYLGNLYANINFDKSIDRQIANQLIKIASDISYRQLAILYVIGAYQNRIINSPKRRESPFSGIRGYSNISIASEIFDLYRRSLIFSKNVILDAAGFTPSLLEISGVGALLYNLMELSTMPFDQIARSIVNLLCDNSQ